MSDNSEQKKKSFGEVISDSLKELADTFKAFFNAPKALWGINVPYILEGLVYFGILTILGKYASENINLADTQASLIYSGVTGGITFAMLLFGGYADKLGVRTSLALALLCMLVGRTIVAISGSIGLESGLGSPMFYMLLAGMFLMVCGYGLYQPAAYAGIKRYTTPKTAAMGYAVIYGFMNLGAFFSGFISSFTRPNFVDEFPPNGLTAVFWVYVVITLSALILSIILLSKKTDRAAVEEVKKLTEEENEGKEEDAKVETVAEENVKINNLPAIVLGGLALISFLFSNIAFGNSFDININIGVSLDIFVIIAAVFAILACAEFLKKRPDHPFRDGRFSFLIFVLIPVQTLFAHNWLTLPYYLDRAFAGSFIGEYFEIFSNLNPLLIFVIAPIVAGLTARANVYKMMIIGTLVMAAPTFLLAVGPNPYLLLIYIFIMTLGESMWQPRFLQWIAEVAPEGKTGLYMGVGQFPWFLTKVVTGFYSGWFLTQYCPKDVLPQNMNTEFMWLVYAIIAMISPIALIMAKKWVQSGLKEKH